MFLKDWRETCFRLYGGVMGRNIERDEREYALRMQEIAMTAFSVFAERTIEKVTMIDIAKACGKGISSIYRHYKSKPELVLAAATVAWESYIREHSRRYDPGKMTAAEQYEAFLDSFLDLYRNRRDLLRFNQFFNVYVQSEDIPAKEMEPYMAIIRGQFKQFHDLFFTGLRDGSLKTDTTEGEMFSTTLHLMLAAVTRYAVGLVFTEGTDQEKELPTQKNMLMKRYTVENRSQCPALSEDTDIHPPVKQEERI
jgi:AcrR family transcriptional regulator